MYPVERIFEHCERSIVRAITDSLKYLDIPVYIEGQQDQTEEYLQIRFDAGELVTYTTHYAILYSVNIFITLYQQDNDLYRGSRILGLVAKSMPSSIAILALGNLPDDTEEQVGCFTRVGGQDSVQFGRTSNVSTVRQALISANYSGEISRN